MSVANAISKLKINEFLCTQSGVAECRYEAIAGTSKAGSKFLEIIPVFSNAHNLSHLPTSAVCRWFEQVSTKKYWGLP